MVKKKIGTVTLALGLIATGTLMFIENFTDLPINNINDYWPLLIVGLGLEMIIYTLVYGRKNENVKLSINGLCIVFIIITAVFVKNPGRLINVNVKNIGDIPFVDDLGYRGEIEKNLSKSGISKDYNIKKLTVTNNFGDVVIKKGNYDDIKVEATIRVQYNDESKAKDYAQNAVRIEEGEVTNIYIEDVSNANRRDYESARVDFDIYIPENIDLDIKNSFGDINVEGGGQTKIENSYGDINVIECSKDADIKSSFGKIRIEDIDGSIDAISSNGDIIVEAITGNVKVKTSFGNIDVENVKGNIEAVSKNGGIEISEAKGDIEAETLFGNIEIDEESIENGKVFAQTSFGSIQGFRSGAVDSGNKKTLDTKLGNASREITLKTSNGNIVVE